MSTKQIGIAAFAAGAIALTSVATSGALEPAVTDVGSSVAARSTDGAGRAIYYTDGSWYHADGTPVSALADVPRAVEPTVADVGSSVAARSTDSAGRSIYYTDGSWYQADGTPVPTTAADAAGDSRSGG